MTISSKMAAGSKWWGRDETLQLGLRSGLEGGELDVKEEEYTLNVNVVIVIEHPMCFEVKDFNDKLRPWAEALIDCSNDGGNCSGHGGGHGSLYDGSCGKKHDDSGCYNFVTDRCETSVALYKPYIELSINKEEVGND